LRQEHRTPIRKFKRIMVYSPIMLVDLSKDRRFVIGYLHVPNWDPDCAQRHSVGKRKLGSRKHAHRDRFVFRRSKGCFLPRRRPRHARQPIPPAAKPSHGISFLPKSVTCRSAGAAELVCVTADQQEAFCGLPIFDGEMGGQVGVNQTVDW
jgi:hypothetical protein